ncbi:MAG TPA: beta-ketoacyl synthase chain length factor [Steroidobacteraceae bacterium]|nr:beta-ketoacyl synthase chain length factor [Steroidobacteraceae bacterium]
MTGGAFLETVGLVAPGLPTWEHAEAVLTGRRDIDPAIDESTLAPPAPQSLPANERRRAPLQVLVALAAAESLLARTAFAVPDTPSVFASSDADMSIMHRICVALAEPARMVSPTDFHNSVHNAPAGYWGIAARATRSATTLSAFDATAIAGLRECLALIEDGAPAALLVLCDVPAPVPLLEKRPMHAPCGIALMLVRDALGTRPARISFDDGHAETPMSHPRLERLRLGNPAARVLPILEAVAKQESRTVGLRAEDDRLAGVRVQF